MIKYLNGENKNYLTLSFDYLKAIKWYVKESFLVHPNVKSHTGVVITMGQGSMQSFYSKRKLNTSISTEAELVSVGDTSVYIL